MDRVQAKVPPQIMNSRDMETPQWSDIYLDAEPRRKRVPSDHGLVERVWGKPQAEVQSGASPTACILMGYSANRFINWFDLAVNHEEW